MTKIILLVCITLLGFYKADAQNITNKIDKITFKIDSITNQERKLLKKEVKAIEKQYNNEKISLEDADLQKKQVTEKHATAIQEEIYKLENELHIAIQERVNNELINPNEIEKQTTLYFGSKGLHITTTNRDSDLINETGQRKNRRTYSNLLYAFGLNNLITNTDLNSIQDAPYEFGGSQFFELGLNYKTRLFKESPLWYVDYGLSVRYNKLRPKDNKYFVTNGGTTTLETFEHDYKYASFKNVQLVVPLFLELDFSKPKMEKDQKIFKRNKAFKFGIGAFGGINVKSKQKIIYKLDGKRKKDKTTGDYNVNRFVYGLNSFIGYKNTSFYVKYDMNDLFDNNFKDQHNFSFGVRLDL